MSTYYPVFLNIASRKCLVVGGGEVAERKVKTLLEHNALVEVVSPHISHGLTQLSEQGVITVSKRGYQSQDLDDALLVIVATNNAELNANVARDASKVRVLTNVVDLPEQSDFIVPSLLRRGNISIAISTNGKSPALSRKIRTELECSFPSEYETLVGLVSEVRQELKRNKVYIDSATWQGSLNLQQLIDMIRAGQYDQAKKKLLSDLRGMNE